MNETRIFPAKVTVGRKRLYNALTFVDPGTQGVIAVQKFARAYHVIAAQIDPETLVIQKPRNETFISAKAVDGRSVRVTEKKTCNSCNNGTVKNSPLNAVKTVAELEAYLEGVPVKWI